MPDFMLSIPTTVNTTDKITNGTMDMPMIFHSKEKRTFSVPFLTFLDFPSFSCTVSVTAKSFSSMDAASFFDFFIPIPPFLHFL